MIAAVPSVSTSVGGAQPGVCGSRSVRTQLPLIPQMPRLCWPATRGKKCCLDQQLLKITEGYVIVIPLLVSLNYGYDTATST